MDAAVLSDGAARSLGHQHLPDIGHAVQETVAWTKVWLSGGDLNKYMQQQIRAYFREG